jgi:predicted dehydrogenase
MEKIGSAKVNGKVSYGFGIVGCGMISAVHADVIKALPNAHLVGVCDHSLARATAFAEKHGGRAFADADALYAAEGIDVIVICTPSGTHTELTVAALRTGHHVLIEKPLALTLEGIEAIGRAKEESGRTVAVVSQQRFSPAFCKIHSLIAEGALGDLLLADLAMPYHRDPSYYEAVAWRGTKAMDGGELFNQGVHGIDILLYLCGEVTAVSGACRTLTHRIEAEDTTVSTLRFASGALATFVSTTCAYPGVSTEICLYGTREASRPMQTA